MWIFQNNSFISAVQDRGNADNLMVRARIEGDIESAFPGYIGYEVTEYSDYPWRCSIPKIVVANRVWEALMGVTYENFKGSIPNDPKRHTAYMRVWSAMADYEYAVKPPEKKSFMSALGSAPWRHGPEVGAEIPDAPTGDGKCWRRDAMSRYCGEHRGADGFGMFFWDSNECDYAEDAADLFTLTPTKEVRA